MGTHFDHDATVSPDDINTGDLDAESSKIDLVVETSSNGERSGELGNAAESITRVELNLACLSEKLVNLSVLTMHVATKESDFEALASSKGHMFVDPLKTLEFDLLSGILDSEVTELDMFISALQTEIMEAREVLSSCKHVEEEALMAMEDKLCDSEKSVHQSQDQVSEIREQYAKFQRTLLGLDRQENWSDAKGLSFLEEDQMTNVNAKIGMKTAEQQMHTLRMLEKSLAREIDLEKKLVESRQVEEHLKHRLLSLEQQAFFSEEETVEVYERYLGAENTAEILMSVSKELLGRLQIFQFNLNGSVRREAELRSKLENSTQKLKAEESALQKVNDCNTELNDHLVAQIDQLKASLKEAEGKLVLTCSESFTLVEKVSLLDKQLMDSEFHLQNAKVTLEANKEQSLSLQSEITELESAIDVLKDKLSVAESRAKNAEARNELLVETNSQLNEELGHLRAISEKVDSLERQLKDNDIKLQHAEASSEASLEKQNMLYATIRDMENVIEGLKVQVSRAQSRADSAEDKCITLSESDAELNEELGLLRSRLECLDSSLNQADKTKMASAKDIGFCTKVITDLVLQLAIERDRLHKQISMLAVENRTLTVNLQKAKQNSPVVASQHKDGKDNFSATDFELSENQRRVSVGETKKDSPDAMSELGDVRRIDAELLNRSHILVGVLIALVSAVLYFGLPPIQP